VESLRQSILEQAFSGQLVPQDPDDELASVLLERIHTEREARSETDTHKSRFNTLGHAHRSRNFSITRGKQPTRFRKSLLC
jgi:hypothetical protein